MSLEIVRGIEHFRRPSDRPVVVTIGTFDGIHLGHQEILRRVLDTADKSDSEPILVTFHPHPKTVVTPNDAPLLLTTIEEKERFLPHFFRGTVLILDFNAELRNLTAEEFVRDILIGRLGMSRLIIGYDHAFGKNRSGSIVELKKLGADMGFEVEVVGPVTIDDQRVSSSAIRRLLAAGNFRNAIEFLGHPYAIYGEVERGIGLGRKLGYPTANVRYNPRKLLPTEGVYACHVDVGDVKKDGMMFIGRNHFNPDKRVTVEANLFDFDEDIYGRGIIVCPTHYIRPNQRYDSTDDLVGQIKLDKKEVLSIFDKEKQDANTQRNQSPYYC